MRRALLVPLLVISGMLLPGWASAAPDSDALLNLLRSARFTPLTHVGELPLPVLRVCLNDPEQVAEPGGPFNPTDAGVPGHTEPHERLVWAATDGEHYVAEFEYGGIGYHRTILVVDNDPSGTAKVLAVTDGEKVSSVDELIEAAAASKTQFWRELGRYH
jgi:hypothetical protein